MEKDKFKDFIDEHHEEFDQLEPSVEVWKGIKKETQKEKKLFDSRVFLRIAASLFLLLGSAWIVLQIANKPTDQFVEEDPVKEEVKNNFAFIGLSDELVEVERYYLSEVSLKENELSNHNVDAELLEELDFLKEEFELLREEMEQSADPMKVVEAMINNYQLQLDILEDILNQIEREREKKLQNGKDENYV